MGVYLPLYRKQLDGSVCQGSNCNMCSAAMLADRMTLGVVKRSGAQMRLLSGTVSRCTDGIVGNDGTSQADALTALARLGLYPRAYQDFDLVKLRLSFARGLILSIDYGSVPLALRGDKVFTGRHAIYVNATDGAELERSDPLCDGRRAGIPRDPTWTDRLPYEAAAQDYRAGGGNIYCIVNPGKYLTPIEDWCNVRPDANRDKPPIAVLRRGTVLESGARVVLGESIGGNPRWRIVWLPDQDRTGYVHDSVGRWV